MDAALKMEEYLRSTIEAKEQEITTLGGELSALRSNLAALRNFREQEKHAGGRQ